MAKKKAMKRKGPRKQKTKQKGTEARLHMLLNRLEHLIVIIEATAEVLMKASEVLAKPPVTEPTAPPVETVTQEEADALIESGEAEIPEGAVIDEPMEPGDAA